jgi:hypothetical protein
MNSITKATGGDKKLDGPKTGKAVKSYPSPVSYHIFSRKRKLKKKKKKFLGHEVGEALVLLKLHWYYYSIIMFVATWYYMIG